MAVSTLVALVKVSVLFGGVLAGAAYFVLVERRMAAWIQDRRGPNRVGIPLTRIRLFGLGQPIADGAKMILKEEYSPAHVDHWLYVIAPMIIMTAALSVYAVIPFGNVMPPIPALGIEEPIPLLVAPQIDVGMVYVFALSSIAVYGVILGGWASNNKYSFLGALRSSAQMISYELPMGLAILAVVLYSGSLRLDQIVQQQAEHGWFVLLQPLGFVVFVVAAFAEAGRLPFDLPECEQELVAGFHTEYSGMKLVLFLTAEFIHMITAAFLITILFLGGWHLPWITGTGGDIGWAVALLRMLVLLAKIVVVILFFMLVRWSWPRFRFDQLMALAWKVMLPLGVANLLAVAVLAELQQSGSSGESFSGFWVALSGWVVAAVGWLIVGWCGPLLSDNRPRLDLKPHEIDSQI